MRHFWQWFTGYICILLRGTQLNRFINLCSKNGIQLWRIKYLDRNMQVHIKLKDFYYLKPYLRKTKTKLRIIKKYGFPFWCFRHPKLRWLLVLFVCIFFIFMYSFQFIWKIEMIGNQKISNNDVLEFLEINEIKIGTKIDEINYTDLEYKFRQKFNDVGWISIYLNKTKLCVEVKESLYDKYSFENNEDRVSYHLVAQKDATIYSIVTRQGIPLVKKGQRVLKGQILVQGNCNIYDDSGMVKETLPLKADALIYADTNNQIYASMTEIEIIALKIAGNYSEKSLLFLGNRKFKSILEKIEENGVIILDKNVIIDNDEKNIVFLGDIYTREQIGINILAEE